MVPKILQSRFYFPSRLSRAAVAGYTVAVDGASGARRRRRSSNPAVPALAGVHRWRLSKSRARSVAGVCICLQWRDRFRVAYTYGSFLLQPPAVSSFSFQENTNVTETQIYPYPQQVFQRASFHRTRFTLLYYFSVGKIFGAGFFWLPWVFVGARARFSFESSSLVASDMMNGENGGIAKPTPPPTLPKSYTPSAAAAYRLASMERLAQRQRIFEQGGPPPPPPGASFETQQPPSPAVSSTTVGPPPPVTAPKPVLGTKASIVVVGRSDRNFFLSKTLFSKL